MASLGSPTSAIAASAFAPISPKRLLQRLPNRATRIEGRVRVLEDDLHPTSQSAQRGALCRSDIGAIEDNRAAIGLDEPKYRTRDRRFAAAGFPHKAKGRPPWNAEGDIVDRANNLGLRPSPLREMLGEIANHEMSAATKGFRHQRIPPVSRTEHRTKCPGSPQARSSGRSSLQLRCLKEQRGAYAQPGGIVVKVGAPPGIGSRLSLARSARGMAPSSAAV